MNEDGKVNAKKKMRKNVQERQQHIQYKIIIIIIVCVCVKCV